MKINDLYKSFLLWGFKAKCIKLCYASYMNKIIIRSFNFNLIWMGVYFFIYLGLVDIYSIRDRGIWQLKVWLFSCTFSTNFENLTTKMGGNGKNNKYSKGWSSWMWVCLFVCIFIIFRKLKFKDLKVLGPFIQFFLHKW